MKPLIDILDEMNLREDKVKENLIEKIERLANLIFDIEHKVLGDPAETHEKWVSNPELIFVNHLLEEIIEGKKIVRPELEKCNRLYKQYSGGSTDNRKSTEENMWKLVDSMLTQENPSKIQAIKMYRRFITNASLRESKEVVDAREQKLKRGW